MNQEGNTDFGGRLRGEGRAGEKHPLRMEMSDRCDGSRSENFVAVVGKECNLLRAE